MELLAIILTFFFQSVGIPPCPTEDSSNCYWVESEYTGQGNGVGRWFIDIDGQVYYLTHR